jgi:hypothetical protein
LLPYFPEMEGASSDDWHAFLDQTTGLTTPIDEQNATAFDRWRQALAAMDIPVWSITPAGAAQMAARGNELKELAALARASQAKRTAAEMARLAAVQAELKKEAAAVAKANAKEAAAAGR